MHIHIFVYKASTLCATLNGLSDIDHPINYECPLDSDLSCQSSAQLLKSHTDTNTGILINESHMIAPGRWLSVNPVWICGHYSETCIKPHMCHKRTYIRPVDTHARARAHTHGCVQRSLTAALAGL